jgi:hypothetical protein
VQTKIFVVDFASADDTRWEALLEELKPIEVGVLGMSPLLKELFLSLLFFCHTPCRVKKNSQ